MKHQICIGKVYNSDMECEVAKRTIFINEAQKNILLLFANRTVDRDGYPIYNINGCEFRIWVCFGDEPYFKQKQEENQALLNKWYEEKQNSEKDKIPAP